MKRMRFVLVLAVLLSALAFGAVQTQEALAVAPCGTMCNDLDDCFKKCACETPEWGIHVELCLNCPWAPGNPCV